MRRATTRERERERGAKRRRLTWFFYGFGFAVVIFYVFGSIRCSMITSLLLTDPVSRDEPSNMNLAVTDLSEPQPTQTTAVEPFNEEHSVPSPFCFAPNSEVWLNGPRYGNADDTMDDTFVKATILGMREALSSKDSSGPDKNENEILGQTICYKESRFLNDSETKVDPKSIRLWTVRLIYLAMHYHQHKRAIPEALARYSHENNGSCSSQMDAKGIGKFDYECPNAKHLIISLDGNGLGINLRGTNTPGIVAALSSDRVLHVLNNVAVNRTNLTTKTPLERPWGWASCDRRDFQCVFMPPTPCALTHEDVLNAYHLTNPEARALKQRGIPPAGHEHDKVWITPSFGMPLSGISKPASLRLNSTIQELINQIPENDSRLVAIRMAADSLFQKEERRDGWHYAMATGRVEHAAVMYSARVNLRYTPTMNAAIEKSIPKHHNFENTIGVPVRASDKCKRESECLSFYQHMAAASHLWSTHLEANNSTLTKPSVVFTSDSKAMAKEQVDFSSNSTIQRTLPHQFEFVTNLRDRHPDSGYARGKEIRTSNVTLDDAMLDVMSTLKLQMLPRVTMGNCCSNFHVLLGDFLMEGCGAASENTFHCIQEHPDPRYLLCCSWHKDCPAQRQQRLEDLNLTRPV